MTNNKFYLTASLILSVFLFIGCSVETKNPSEKSKIDTSNSETVNVEQKEITIEKPTKSTLLKTLRDCIISYEKKDYPAVTKYIYQLEFASASEEINFYTSPGLVRDMGSINAIDTLEEYGKFGKFRDILPNREELLERCIAIDIDRCYAIEYNRTKVVAVWKDSGEFKFIGIDDLKNLE
jgi:hypothetical protein